MEDWPIDPRSLDGARDADNIEHQVGVRPEPRWSDKSADPFKSQEIMAQQRWEIYRKYRYMGNLWEIYGKSLGNLRELWLPCLIPRFLFFKLAQFGEFPLALLRPWMFATAGGVRCSDTATGSAIVGVGPNGDPQQKCIWWFISFSHIFPMKLPRKNLGLYGYPPFSEHWFVTFHDVSPLLAVHSVQTTKCV